MEIQQQTNLKSDVLELIKVTSEDDSEGIESKLNQSMCNPPNCDPLCQPYSDKNVREYYFMKCEPKKQPCFPNSCNPDFSY